MQGLIIIDGLIADSLIINIGIGRVTDVGGSTVIDVSKKVTILLEAIKKEVHDEIKKTYHL